MPALTSPTATATRGSRRYSSWTGWPTSRANRAMRTWHGRRGAGLTGATRLAPPCLTGQRVALRTGSTMGASAIVQVLKRTSRLALRSRPILNCSRWLEPGRAPGNHQRSRFTARRPHREGRRVFLLQLSEPLRDRVRARHVGHLALVQESAHSRREGAAERLGLKGANVRSVEAGEGVGGEGVITACLFGRLLPKEACGRESVVPGRADVVLRLPNTPPFDIRSREGAVDDAPAEEV